MNLQRGLQELFRQFETSRFNVQMIDTIVGIDLNAVANDLGAISTDPHGRRTQIGRILTESHGRTVQMPDGRRAELTIYRRADDNRAGWYQFVDLPSQ